MFFDEMLSEEQLGAALRARGIDRRQFMARAGQMGLLASGAISVASFIAACGGGPTTIVTSNSVINQLFPGSGKAVGQGVTIQDGMMLAMTGQGSFFGKVMSRGAQLAGKQIKASGGPEFVITIVDHQSGLVPPAVTGVRQLITLNKIVTLQTSYGAPSEAIIPLIEQNKVLSFNGGGSSPGQLFKDYLWQTRMLFAYDPADGGLAWLAKNHPDVKKLAVLGTNENGVETWRDKVPRIWPILSSGGIIATREIHDVGLTDFSAIIARVKASGADAVFTVSFGNDLGYQVKQFRQANFSGPILGIEFTQQAQQVAGASYDTFNFATDLFDATNPNPFTAQFVKAHKSEYGEDPEYYGANYYEQVFVIWELMRRVIKNGGEPTNATQLQQALKDNPTFLSVYGGDANKAGTMTFDLNDHSISKPMGVFAVKNGAPVLLAPIKKVGVSDAPASALLG
ncbi:MAG: ABC transporter substrate-binding protein [Candidatus Dormibacteraceae bacterium]